MQPRSTHAATPSPRSFEMKSFQFTFVARALYAVRLLACCSLLLVVLCGNHSLYAQNPSQSSSELLSGVDSATMQDLADASKQPRPAPTGDKPKSIDFLTLLIRGGIFMIPIALTSIVAVTFIIDRFIGLRSSNCCQEHWFGS